MATLLRPPVSEKFDFVGEAWSEWQDLNLRPPRPERGVGQLLTNDIRELKANIRERSNRLGTRKTLKLVGPGEVATMRADNDLQKGAGD